MPKAVYICDPGVPRHLTPEQMAEKCKCRHERSYHWWGGGACGDCDECAYFRPRKEPSTSPANQNITTAVCARET